MDSNDHDHRSRKKSVCKLLLRKVTEWSLEIDKTTSTQDLDEVPPFEALLGSLSWSEGVVEAFEHGPGETTLLTGRQLDFSDACRFNCIFLVEIIWHFSFSVLRKTR